MNKMLKLAIVKWLVESENVWQRVIECHKWFSRYIYDENGEYLIGGKEISKFIRNADKLLYGKNPTVEVEY